MGPLSAPGWSVGPTDEESVWLPVEDVSAVAAARRRATALAEPLGFEPDRLAQIALAASEAASNLHKHARDGTMTLRVTRAGGVPAIELVCIDKGPGMSDVPRSLRDGYSTSGTLGIGLGAINRLADRSDLHSVPGRGSVLTAAFAVQDEPAEPAPDLPYAGLTRPIRGEQICGDAYAVHYSGDRVLALLCDGLGHGPLAATASQEAVRAVREADPDASPVELLRLVHRRLRPTRGGAVAVAAIDFAARTVRFAGLGNVAGWVVGPDARRGMISVPGIAGHQARTFREYSYDLPAGGAVVLHSDGLTDRWKTADTPGLLARAPLVVAAVLLRDAGVRQDDRSIVVIKEAG
ncbi:ATP-binding SpoIIE family protein phosphatase [Actinomadura flavalba]|uniref:ATP-binding SpoIIE family protein phosphatase n=1 Tax=Actinomadura flavalba TaxID=1120938 RepID=UPI0003794846|nr:ATP-binding SpoIIE family protein phosphatase [Actinomadura flavalba]